MIGLCLLVDLRLLALVAAAAKQSTCGSYASANCRPLTRIASNRSPNSAKRGAARSTPNHAAGWRTCLRRVLGSTGRIETRLLLGPVAAFPFIRGLLTERLSAARVYDRLVGLSDSAIGPNQYRHSGQPR